MFIENLVIVLVREFCKYFVERWERSNQFFQLSLFKYFLTLTHTFKIPSNFLKKLTNSSLSLTLSNNSKNPLPLQKPSRNQCNIHLNIHLKSPKTSVILTVKKN
jgi:hypothetical protein